MENIYVKFLSATFDDSNECAEYISFGVTLGVMPYRMVRNAINDIINQMDERIRLVARLQSITFDGVRGEWCFCLCNTSSAFPLELLDEYSTPLGKAFVITLR